LSAAILYFAMCSHSFRCGHSRSRLSWTAGRESLPESAPWLNDFVDELTVFPKGTLFIAVALIYLLCDTLPNEGKS
jgi:hypothetical protein